ncbi:MAG: TatD family hydrolase [Myxococcota bacterium]|nr:TatD family hydrolase [Myxococcota bacterium]
MWIDSHCHITADAFAEDRSDVMARAEEAGVGAMLAIGAGYGVEHNAKAVSLAAADPRVFATVGVHPHDARDWSDDAARRLRGWLREPRVVAVGECGLDYYYENSPREAQREALARQLSLARELERPVCIHVRDRDGESDAYEELLALWEQEGRGRLEGVLHCYTHDLPFARRAVEQGFRVSFSGIMTFKRAGDLRDVAAGLPLDRLLVETDAPFLAPEGHRGKRNEPAFVVRVGETLAALHGKSVEEVAEITSRNAREFYALPSGRMSERAGGRVSEPEDA